VEELKEDTLSRWMAVIELPIIYYLFLFGTSNNNNNNYNTVHCSAWLRNKSTEDMSVTGIMNNSGTE
jgi:hypothetical protein